MPPTITVMNESGQVASFDVTGSGDPRAEILQQRIDRGELKKVSKDTKPGEREPLLDSDAGKTDEVGDYLKSVHGGGLDPDADGDAVGQPSGSKAPAGASEGTTEAPASRKRS